MPEVVDVVIVGARCAGSAVAVPFARAGRTVVVLDKAKFPADTISTHAMTPNAVQELALMGALDRILALGPARSPYLTVHDGDVYIRERFRPFGGVTFGLCIPRDQQDVLLVETVRAAGADVREHCLMEEVVWRGGRAVGVRYRTQDSEREIHAKLVVGADGRRSRVAAEVGAWTPYRGSKNGRGFAYRYVDDPLGLDTDAYNVYRYGRTVTLVLPACPAGRTVVVHMCPSEEIPSFRRDPERMWEAKLEADPDGFGARMGGATEMTRMRSTDDLASYYRCSSGPGWALVGDAGHFKDPVAGQGMRDAFRHGRLLAEAVAPVLDDPAAVDDRLFAWERERDKDTSSTYHWANRESRPHGSSPLVREVLRGFVGNDEPDLSDTFNRGRTIERILGPGRLARAVLTRARTPGVDRRALLAEVRRELPLEIGARRHRLLDGFRSTRPTATERPGWEPDTPPRPPSWRPAATQAEVEAPAAEAVS